MAGLIMTAKALTKQLEKARKERVRFLDADISQAETMKGCNCNPAMSDYYKKKLDDAIHRREHFDWEEWECNQINEITKAFRVQCRMAVRLRDIAMEEGLIKSEKDNNGTPLLDDSPALTDVYALITIRPEPGTCLVFFEQRIALLMERPWILGAEYHFEQVGTDESTMGDGFHVHIVAKLKKSIRVPEITKDCTADLEPIRFRLQIGEEPTASKKRVRKFLKTARDLEFALNYIRGYKHNEDKEDAVEMDKEWRRLNGLQDVYYVGHWDNRESRTDAVIIEEVV